MFPRGALARPGGAAAAGPQARAHAAATAGLSRERCFCGRACGAAVDGNIVETAIG